MLILLISTFVYFIINVNLFIEYMNQLFDSYRYLNKFIEALFSTFVQANEELFLY